MSSVTYEQLNDKVALLYDDGKPVGVATLETTQHWVVHFEGLQPWLGRGTPGYDTLEEMVKHIEHKYRSR